MAGKVTPNEAHALMTNEGYAYLDVRTVAEFEAGHPAGAYNLPLLIDGPGGRGPNAAFVGVATTTFPKDAKLVVGCLAGGRAARAAELLEGAGYTNVTVQGAGWGGLVDAFGRVTQPGWKAAGLPTATGAEPGHAWTDLGTKK
jgi:rhodanese-related sulfurtransferase